MSLYYFGTQESLPHQEAFHFNKYRKKTPFYRFQHFYIDKAIFTPVNLDCQNCHFVHPSTCCEDGQPYSMTKIAEQQLAIYGPAIIKRYLDTEKNKDAKQNGYLEPYFNNPEVTVIKKCTNGDCFFLGRSADQSFCSIHRFAEQQRIKPYHLKPFSCTLFPLDIIQEQENMYLTGLTEETMKFSRWGSQYKGYLCIDQKQREALQPVDAPYFPLGDYKPAWEWNSSLLEHHFGVELMGEIQRLGAEVQR